MGWKGYRLSPLPHIMARRKGPSLDPSSMTLTFTTAASAGVPVVSYVDLSQVTSLVNRRFYRQGLNWGVAGIKVTSLVPGAVVVEKLPTTWVMANAWKKSFSVWSRMNSEALSESSSIRPRFLDFKVYADAEHHGLGYVANLLPQNAAGGSATPGEWESSKIVIPDTTDPAGGIENREVIAVGGNYPGVGASGLGAVSMIEGYAASRGLPNVLDPNVPDDADDADGPTPANWMTAVFNDGTQQADAVMSDMSSENNIAPYPFENDGVHIDTMYPGGANQLSGLEWHDFTQIYSTSATTNVGIASIKGGAFPCGLVKITWTSTESAGNLVFQINMLPGSHRGYLAESMQDM
jgi:hypothetical protein